MPIWVYLIIAILAIGLACYRSYSQKQAIKQRGLELDIQARERRNEDL